MLLCIEKMMLCVICIFSAMHFFSVKENDYLIRNMMHNYVLYNNKNWCVIANVIIIVNLYILTAITCSKIYLLLCFKIIVLYDDLTFIFFVILACLLDFLNLTLKFNSVMTTFNYPHDVNVLGNIDHSVCNE
jgi:hypothetical protein